jgi:iron complex outermembrane recepter protein
MRRTALARLAGSTAAAALVAFAGPVTAQIQEQAYKFNLPAQELGGALRAFGQVSHQQIIFSEDTVRGKKSPALVGSFTVDQGLQRLLASSGLSVHRTPAGVIAVGNAPAAVDPSAKANAVTSQVSEMTVTGSRIRRTDTSTEAPMSVIDGGALAERGYTNVGDMLNQVTSNAPEFPEAPFQGFPGGSGQTFPNLFNLGEGRTLTLIDGRRMVTSSSGLGERAVDVNVIPAGLIQRVDIVEAGGAAVYGSDAIAGVVNYILKKDFQGAEFDAQYGQDYNGGYRQPSLRATFGTNFADGRGNIAADLEFSKSSPLLEEDREFTGSGARSVTNLANTSTSDGIPPTLYVFNGHAWRYNANGVIFASNSTSASALLRSGGSALQFSPDGQTVIPYDTGVIQGVTSTAVGGQGLDFRTLSTLVVGVERANASVIGHYDLTDHIKLSSEFIYGHEQGTDPFGTQSIVRFVGGGAGQEAISFNNGNPFLSAADIAALSAASPGFAAGQNLTLSKFLNVMPTREGLTTTDTGRLLVALDGDFEGAGRDFYWSLSASHGETYSAYQVYQPYLAHLTNALNAVKNASGQIVCAINAMVVTDPACAPLNPFGANTASTAAGAYVSVETGSDVYNTQDDYLATIGGDILSLPGGKAKFSLAYEHRAEAAKFTPSAADQAGLSFSSSVQERGAYHTDEFSGELLVPIVGGDFTLPLVRALEVNGSYRVVDNSLAGHNTVWGAGVRWEVGYGLAFRASKSRNFSAPTLDEQFAPTSVSPGNPAADPCDVTNINGGPNPAVRLANCKALFAAHPEWGPLASFNDPAVNTGVVSVTYGGNPNLHNEISNTKTYGLVFQPDYVPGLTFGVDRIEVDLTGALSEFAPNNFLSTCFDTNPQPADICSTFTRDSHGDITTATDEFFNAGSLTYRGEVYKFDYAFPLSRFFSSGRELGGLDLAVEATHTSLLQTSVTGFDLTRSDGTTAMPSWRSRYDVRYARGPLRLFYSLYALPSSKSTYTATIETTPVPILKANYTQTVSIQYDFKPFTFRAGVDNLTNEQPSFPSRSYGDILGRRYFMGVKARF